jgi:hypothetical protein
MINSLTTPEFETTPIGGLMIYSREEGVERGRYIDKGQAPPGLVVGGRTCGVRRLGIQGL